MNIIKDFIPAGSRNRPGRANPMLYVTIHETGNKSKGAGARSHSVYLKSEAAIKLPVSWHYSVDDKETYQHLPEEEDAYHAGDGNGSGNRQSIGIEMCVNIDGDFTKTVERTIVLVADICTRRGIPAENVRQHFDWSGKDCPHELRAKGPQEWSNFIDKVRAAMKTDAKTDTVSFELFGVDMQIEGIIQNGRTFVSARQLIEAMGGYSVDWDKGTRKVVVRRVPSGK